MIRYSLDKKAPGMFASPHGTYVKVVDIPVMPKLMGVLRPGDNPQALELVFADAPTDDQMRSLMDFPFWMSDTP